MLCYIIAYHMLCISFSLFLSLYIYIYIHTYTCICIYACRYLSLSIYVCITPRLCMMTGPICGRFPKFNRVCLGRDPGTLRSDIVSNKTSTINLFGFETLKLKIRRLKLWKPTVGMTSDHAAQIESALLGPLQSSCLFVDRGYSR